MSLIDVTNMPPMIAQAEITDAIARTLLDAVTTDWTSIEYRRTVLSATSEGRLRIAYGERTEQPLAPRDVAKLAKQLRDVMFQEGSGTWYTFTLTMTPPASVTSQFDYDNEPEWDVPVDPIAYVTDQHTHPRDLEHQPPWLREKLADGWARINDLPSEKRPLWVEKMLSEGRYELTAQGLVARS